MKAATDIRMCAISWSRGRIFPPRTASVAVLVVGAQASMKRRQQFNPREAVERCVASRWRGSLALG